MNSQNSDDRPVVNLGNPPEITSDQLAAALRTGRSVYRDVDPVILDLLIARNASAERVAFSSDTSDESAMPQPEPRDALPVMDDAASEPAPMGDYPDDGYGELPEVSGVADVDVNERDRSGTMDPVPQEIVSVEGGDVDTLTSAIEPERDWKEDPYVYWMSGWLEKMADAYPNRLAMAQAFRDDLAEVLKKAQTEGIVDPRAPRYEINHFIDLITQTIKSIDRYEVDRDAKYDVDLTQFERPQPIHGVDLGDTGSDEDNDERPREPPSPKLLPNGELEMTTDEMLALHAAHLLGPTRQSLEFLYGDALDDMPEVLESLRLREEKAAEMKRMAANTDPYEEVRGTSMDPLFGGEHLLPDTHGEAHGRAASQSVVGASSSIQGKDGARSVLSSADDVIDDSIAAQASNNTSSNSHGVASLDEVPVSGHIESTSVNGGADSSGDPGPEPEYPISSDSVVEDDPSVVAENVEQMNRLNEKASERQAPYIPISPFSQLTPEQVAQLEDRRRPQDRTDDESQSTDKVNESQPDKAGARSSFGPGGKPEDSPDQGGRINIPVQASAVEAAVTSAFVTAGMGVAGAAKGVGKLVDITRGGLERFKKNGIGAFHDALFDRQRAAAEKLITQAEQILNAAEQETDPTKVKQRIDDAIKVIGSAVIKSDEISSTFSRSTEPQFAQANSTICKVKAVAKKAEDHVVQRIKDGQALEEQLAAIRKHGALLENILTRLRQAFDFIRLKMGLGGQDTSPTQENSDASETPGETLAH